MRLGPLWGLLLALRVSAQEPSRADLLLSRCALDTAADAYVLIKTGEADFNLYGQGFLETHYHFRIKILLDKGVSRANVVLPYYAYDRYDEITSVSGCTFNLVGSKVVTARLDRAGVFYKPLDRYYSAVAFTLPDVKKGSIIDYEYTLLSRNFTYVEPWTFQGDAPTRFSSFRFSVPSYFDFTYSVHATLPVEVKDVLAGARATKTFTMRDIPPLGDEPYMSARRDYLQRVDFQIAAVRYPGAQEKMYRRTWDSFNEEMLASDAFGGQLHRGVARADSLRSIPDSVARMAAVLAYVRAHMRWNGVWAWHSESVRAAWAAGVGSTGDINLILVDLLRETGCKAYPLLVSTRQHGMVNTSDPLLAQFDAVMVYCNGYVLNAADPYTPFSYLPFEVRSSEGFVVDPRVSGWVSLVDNRVGFFRTVAVLGALDTLGRLSGSASIVSEGYDKVFALRDSGVASVDTLPLERVFPFSFSLPFSSGYWFLSPDLFSGLSGNAFTTPDRFSDVDFGFTQSYVVTGTVRLPPGFGVVSLPRDVRMITPDTGLSVSRSMRFASGVLSYRLAVGFNRPVYFASEYATFREFYRRMMEVLREPIALDKQGVR